MARIVESILLLTFALLFVRAANEYERWNTPPELTSELVKTLNNEEPQARLFSFNPTATVSLNAGNNNAHSVSLGAGLDGISLAGSNSYNRPMGYGSSVSISNSASVSAGLSGISTANAQAFSNGNSAKTESHSLSLGQATATSFGTVENGQAITGAASSAGTSQSSTTGGNRGQFSQAGANSRYPYWSTWSNIGPSNGHHDQRLDRPTLSISKPCDETRPTLNANAPGIVFRREQKPTIHIYKWRPNRVSRPSISIEHQLDVSRNDRTHGSTSLQVESKDSKQKYPDGDLISDFVQTVGELLDIV